MMSTAIRTSLAHRCYDSDVLLREMRWCSPDPTQSWYQTTSCNLPSLDTLLTPSPTRQSSGYLLEDVTAITLSFLDAVQLFCFAAKHLVLFIFCGSKGRVTMPYCAAWSSPLIIFSQLKFLLCWILVIYIIGSPQTMRSLIVMIPSQKLDQRPINETKNSVKIFKFLLNNTIYFRVLPHFTIFTARDGRH